MSERIDPGSYDVDLSGWGDKAGKLRRFTARLDRVGGVVASSYVGGGDSYICLARIYVAPEQVQWIAQWPGVRSVRLPATPDLGSNLGPGPSTGDDSESEVV